MKNFSFLWCVINLILFIIYVFVAMLLAGLIYGALSSWQTDPVMQDKLGYLMILLVLIVTVICRKFFYKAIWIEKQPEVVVEEKKKSYTSSVKEKAKQTGKSKMKIYVDKEIK